VEMLLGEAMKKCPSCGEHIIKNGGCDHMTCRCRHEFFWSTLLPYRH
jgi:ariadne-1